MAGLNVSLMGARPDAVADVVISGLACDSRTVKPGYVFFAVPGFVTDGARFIPEALSLGASAVVSQSRDVIVSDVPHVVSEDIRQLMSLVADRYYDSPSEDLRVVGITGTNGKTTVSFLVSHIMSSVGQRWGRMGTVGYFTGKRTLNASNTTPESLDVHKYLAEMRDHGLDGCAMEMSSHSLDQHRCDHIRLSAGVFTNLTQDHLDYHKDMESYFKAKSIVFTRLLKPDGIAVLNAADAYFDRVRRLCDRDIITYSQVPSPAAGLPVSSSTADVLVTDAGYRDKRRHFSAAQSGKSVAGVMPHLGVFNLANAAAAIATVVALGIDLEAAVQALHDAPQVPGRVEKVEKGQPFEVIIDYAHTPDALKNLLTGVETNGKKILVFGCGGDRDRIKRPIMGQIAVEYANRVIVTSDNPRTEDPKRIINDILHGIRGNRNYTVEEKRDEAIKQGLALAQKGDLVIIAGKGHENYQVIGNTRYFFSDPEVVKSCLGKMGYEGI